jgi:hypothetical protein
VNEFVNHLSTRLGTTNNYSAIAELHNSQIIIASVEQFSSLLSSTAVSQQRLLAVKIMQRLLLSGEYLVNCHPN